MGRSVVSRNAWKSAAGCVAIVAVFWIAPPGVSAQEATYTFEEEVIRGTIEKPEAFYILSPSSLDYASLDAEESFLDALWDTVEEEPF